MRWCKKKTRDFVRRSVARAFNYCEANAILSSFGEKTKASFQWVIFFFAQTINLNLKIKLLFSFVCQFKNKNVFNYFHGETNSIFEHVGFIFFSVIMCIAF